MGKRMVVILCILFIPVVLPLAAAAQQFDEQENAILSQQLQQSGALELPDLLGDQTQQLLEQNNLDEISPDAVLGTSLFDFLTNLWQIFLDALTKPLTLFFKVTGIIMIFALIHTFSDTCTNQSQLDLFQIISVLCVCAVIVGPAIESAQRAVACIEESSNFMLAFIPIFGGILATSGSLAGSGMYTGVMLGVVNLLSQITVNVIVPIVGVYFGFCIVGSINQVLSIEGMVKTFKTIVMWSLGFLFTIFVGLMSIQGLVASSADTLTMKTAKFMFGSFVPIIGSTISEALNSIQGCLGVIKSTVGVFGILACAFTYLPTLFNLWLLNASVKVSAAISEILGSRKITGVLNGVSGVMTILSSVVLFCALLMIVSTTILLMTGFSL